jgi:hypothetical protein
MIKNNISEHIRIGNRSDLLEVFDKTMRSIEANGDISGYVESVCGEAYAIDCLYAIKDAIDRGIV